MINSEEIEADANRLEAISIKYHTLTESYLAQTNNQTLCYTKVRADLKEILKLNKAAVNIPPGNALSPSPTHIFLSNLTAFELLSFDNINTLCLADETSKEEALALFESSPLGIEPLTIYLNRFTIANDNNYPLANFLLSVKAHQELFTWQEVFTFFIDKPLYALTLACGNPKYQIDFIKQINTPDKASISALYQASTQLSDSAFEQLLPTKASKNIFLNLFTDPEYLPLFSQFSDEVINGVIKLLIDATELEISNKTSLLRALAPTIIDRKIALFETHLNNEKFLLLLDESVIQRFFRHESNTLEKKQQALTIMLDNAPKHLATLGPSLATELCQIASKNQLARLLLLPNVKEALAKNLHTLLDKSNIYILFSTTKDKDKINLLLTEHKALLQGLAPSEVLELAIKKNIPFPLQAKEVDSILSNPSFWEGHNTASQKQIMGALLKGQSNLILVKAFTDHPAYKEAWLRSVINDSKWCLVGQSFFSTKVPATIEKARTILKEKGDGPLSTDSLEVLITLFKTAQKNSHTYSYFFNSFNLRSKEAESFYDRAAQLSSPP